MDMHHKKPKLIWRIFPSFLIIILLSLTAEAWYSTRYFKNFFIESAQKEMTVRTLLVRDRIDRALIQDQLGHDTINALCKELGKAIDTRITVILPSGEVIGDSWARPMTMDNHKNRPEIATALHGETGVAVRYSATLDERLMYIALPLKMGDGQTASVRTAVSIADIDKRVSGVRNSIFLALLLTILAAGGASLYVSRRITRPVEEMRKGAKAFSLGKLGSRLPSTDTRELSQLAASMNIMAGELDKKIMEFKNRSRELEAVHTSMQEGVIAVDGSEKIITINAAAARIFDFAPETLKEKNILEVARNFELQTFIQKALSTHEPVEDDIVIDRNDRMILNIHSTALYDMNEERMGTLIISHDITRIRLLEQMHKDFAANVSHELKTPLTTIKGFIETLQDMMDKPQVSSEDMAGCKRFMGIIEKNVNRMTSLIDDLLDLSRLERLRGTDVAFEAYPLATLVTDALAVCQPAAKAKGIALDTQCSGKITGMVDPILMEQAIVNLVGNAVKYNPEGTQVKVSVTRTGDRIQIRVKDTGAGIGREHLPKLFNRFYRVDKGRSRDQGGTGLGLAIVKHIVQYHNGNIEVESLKGKGTCFTIHIPA